MGKKRFDPLWEIVGERIGLQEVEPDIDASCPYCHVRLHLGAAAAARQRVDCGLCGGSSVVVETGDGFGLEAF